MEIAKIIDGLQSTDNLPVFLLDHVATLEHLYKPIDEYVNLLEALRTRVGDFYRQRCPILFDGPDIITKQWLNQHRSDWEVPGYDYFDNTTSGTTAEKFHYRINRDVYYRIELFEHYLAILREFFVVPSRLIYLISDNPKYANTPMVSKIRTDNAVMTHGLREAVEVLQINKNTTYFDNHWDYFDKFFEFLEANPVDLILADGNSISELLAWIKRNNYKKKICKLLSTTTCMVSDEDLQHLKTRGSIDNWCDHMRCWDGGITFFSCKHNVRHVVEHFSYPMSIDNKLVSQDFFSFSSPFWNYWNGDDVTLGDEYRRCKCGRIYRDFSITREREHIMHHTLTYSIDKVLEGVDCLKRSAVFGTILKVFTSRSLTKLERQTIRTALPDMHIRFVVEQ